MKTVLFLPGFPEDINTRDYNSTLDAIASRGYKVKFVPIRWVRTIIDDWMAELDSVYEQYDPSQTILAGFSYGALTAFMTATKRMPSELWLFSLSPYFADDMPKMKKSWLAAIGHRRADAFRGLDFDTLATAITCKTIIVVGEVEAVKYPLVGARAVTAHKRIDGSHLYTSPGSDHDVTDKQYIETIKAAI